MKHRQPLKYTSAARSCSLRCGLVRSKQIVRETAKFWPVSSFAHKNLFAVEFKFMQICAILRRLCSLLLVLFEQSQRDQSVTCYHNNLIDDRLRSEKLFFFFYFDISFCAITIFFSKIQNEYLSIQGGHPSSQQHTFYFSNSQLCFFSSSPKFKPNYAEIDLN